MEPNVAKPLNILIVEDDMGDTKLLHNLLRQSAFPVSDVKCVERLETALESLDGGNFDVVFLDLGLPDSRGIDLVSTVNAKAPNVPIIVLSGLDDVEMGVTAAQKGAEDYLVNEQLNSDLLTLTVQHAIERKRTK